MRRQLRDLGASGNCEGKGGGRIAWKGGQSSGHRELWRPGLVKEVGVEAWKEGRRPFGALRAWIHLRAQKPAPFQAQGDLSQLVSFKIHLGAGKGGKLAFHLGLRNTCLG